MAAPTLNSFTAAAIGTGGTVAVSWAGMGITWSNDLILVIQAMTRNVVGGFNLPTGNPTGWTLVALHDHSGFQLTEAVWIRRHTEGAAQPAATIVDPTGSGDLTMARGFVLTGVNPATPIGSVAQSIDTVEGLASAGANLDASGISVTAPGADSLAVAFVAVYDDILLNSWDGESGGTWVEHTGEATTTTGSDGGISQWKADMSGGGTISGGSLDQAGAGNLGYVIIAFAVQAAVAALGLTHSDVID